MSDGDADLASDGPGDADASPRPPHEERLLTGHTGRLLLTASLGWAAIQAGRLVLSPLLPEMMTGLGISETQAGFAFTVMWGLYAVMQFPSGRLSDRWSRSTLLVPGLLLVGLGFVALAAAPNYLLFLAGAAVVGAGAGLYPTAARAMVSDLFVARRGQAFGLHTASGDAGGAAAAALAVGALAVATWQAAYLPVVAVVGAVAVLLHRFRPDPYEFARVPLGVRGTAARLFATGRLAALLGAYVLYAFTWQGAVSFLPTFLQRAKGFSPALAGTGFAALFVVGALVKPLSGSLGDRFPRAVVAAGALALGAGSLGAMLLLEGELAVSLAVVGFAAGLMAVPPALQAYLMDVFPTDSMGGDLGAARTVYIGLASLGPTYVGFVAGRVGYAPAFGGLLVTLLLAAGIVLAVTR